MAWIRLAGLRHVLVELLVMTLDAGVVLVVVRHRVVQQRRRHFRRLQELSETSAATNALQRLKQSKATGLRMTSQHY